MIHLLQVLLDTREYVLMHHWVLALFHLDQLDLEAQGVCFDQGLRDVRYGCLGEGWVHVDVQ